jgi:hypothetical protein
LSLRLRHEDQKEARGLCRICTSHIKGWLAGLCSDRGRDTGRDYGAGTVRTTHWLNMELDLKSLFGLLCTAVLIG